MNVPQDLLDTVNEMIRFPKVDQWFNLEIEPIPPKDVITGIGCNPKGLKYMGPTTKIGKNLEGTGICRVKFTSLKWEGLDGSVRKLNEMGYVPLEGFVYRSFIKKYPRPCLPENRNILFGGDTWECWQGIHRRSRNERTFFINLDASFSSRAQTTIWQPRLIAACSAFGEVYWMVRSLK